MSRDFRGSRVNRDRRDQAFCQWVIAEAERKRREALCDCVASGNASKPKQHGADPHAKDCAVYALPSSLILGTRDDDMEAVEAATCEHCHKAACQGDCPQYYEALRDEVEERDHED